MENIVANA